MTNADITVLLVDDDEMIRECSVAYLEDEGVTVHGAVSGEEALGMMAELEPSVCISDMRLPGMNGESFICKAHELCPATRYMLHTGMLYSLSDELRALGMRADDVLLKPIHDLSRLVNKIRQSAIVGGRL